MAVHDCCGVVTCAVHELTQVCAYSWQMDKCVGYPLYKTRATAACIS